MFLALQASTHCKGIAPQSQSANTEAVPPRCYVACRGALWRHCVQNVMPVGFWALRAGAAVGAGTAAGGGAEAAAGVGMVEAAAAVAGGVSGVAAAGCQWAGRVERVG